MSVKIITLLNVLRTNFALQNLFNRVGKIIFTPFIDFHLDYHDFIEKANPSSRAKLTTGLIGLCPPAS
ncbi:MAG: hypothetical protein UV76_C0024G0009 [Candidatus Nomurabacteria bacterium GW2011_GWA2_43_15]|uniref:Uncharacterized protein n=1 Tax=Candidatus Nomurabacteria bacterium GW2011_GWA2_43_15 TaxID=1618738 RepID=A0A0G1DMR0_9BACT|nr:MAG: hypothetical protein UV76_C0024G0009 [Candidatus Nomurabacteria bacterium GW2011_GWA2_43_15]